MIVFRVAVKKERKKERTNKQLSLSHQYDRVVQYCVINYPNYMLFPNQMLLQNQIQIRTRKQKTVVKFCLLLSKNCTFIFFLILHCFFSTKQNLLFPNTLTHL